MMWIVVAFLAVILVLLVMILLESREGDPTDHDPYNRRGPETDSESLRDTQSDVDVSMKSPLAPYIGLPDSYQLTPGPTVTTRTGEVSLTEWLRHVRGDSAWANVVEEFYDRALLNPQVAEYFRFTDLPTLRRHFLAALKLVSSDGVTVGVVRAMAQAHSGEADAQGQPIDGAAWDAVIGALAETLVDWQVPQETIGQLAEAIAPLRDVIVREPAAPAGV